MLAYRYLTGEDTSGFCHKVSQALDTGWSLYGDPSYAYDAKEGVMRCAQAVVKEVEGPYDPAMKLGGL